MKAIVQDKYGTADALEFRDIERPTIGDDEVLVRVRAAGVDRGVWHLMTGVPFPIRAGYGLRAPKYPVPGMDLAGEVDAVGSAVTRFQPGDEVMGIGKGAFADYAVAPEKKLVHKPADLTFEQAGVIPISGLTALQAVRDRGAVQPGHHVLITGASGGVGTYAVQVAKALGATVTGVCGPTKQDLVSALGADHVIDYTRQGFADGQQHYDVIIDMGGNSSLKQLRRALTPRGTAVLVGGETGGRWLGGFDRMLRAPLLSVFVGQKLKAFVASENAEDLLALNAMIESGDVTPVIDREFPLIEAADALRYLDSGRARGKLVVTV